MEFQFLIPTKIVVAPKLRQQTGKQLKNLHLQYVLIVTDAGIKQAGLLDDIYASLQFAGIRFEEIADVKPNPRAQDINSCAQEFRGRGLDGILAVGGGSAMDAAKAISVLLTHEGLIEQYEGGFTLKNAVLPIVAIPSTAGTGSEVTFFSVITDTQRRFKMSILDHRIAPVLALLDTDITTSLPPSIAASTGMDAMTHAIEAYTSRLANPISDALALYAIELISNNIELAVNENSNDAARTNMLIASLIAGMAFGNADIASVHCISEALGGMYDTPHGIGNAIFLPFVFDYNHDAAPVRHAKVAYAMGIDRSLSFETASKAAVQELLRMNTSLAIPALKDVSGLCVADFDAIAEKSKNNFSDGSNAKTMTVASYRHIIEMAWNHTV